MVRSILRQVQNTLIIMSVLLVMLAFERLESLDDTDIHKTSAPSSLWPHPPYIDGSSPEEEEVSLIRIGLRHQLSLDTSYAPDSFDSSCLDSSGPRQQRQPRP